jgi:hypothetical protein
MSLITRLQGKFLGFIAEQGAKGKDYDALAAQLEQGRRIAAGRFAAASDSGKNRHQAGHIIGIERWGQRRLRTLLGEPLVMDEYDAYRPGPQASMAELAVLFDETRSETITVLSELQHAAIALTMTAPHNDAGDLSVGGWIVYLSQHATRESHVLIPALS